MFAVIKSGGKQYRVAKDDIIAVEKLLGEPGDTVAFSTVLMLVGEGTSPAIGAPTIEKAQVFAKVLEQSRSDKVVVFKKQRRKKYRVKKGHRQPQTIVRILEVSPSGSRSKAAPKKAAPKKGPGKKATPANKSKPPTKQAKPQKGGSTGSKKTKTTKVPAKKTAQKKAIPSEAKSKTTKKATAKAKTASKTKSKKE
ncbi:MAG: 50S ribosomal protein L21 [Magnetovibrio sp.]|nr:50S ribosomal protein L21 [Magnetovibrio sp.]|tara:strand:+ start:424 stop:1011 length:588 start_codon:yes stop_codon:yes gene_type:complete